MSNSVHCFFLIPHAFERQILLVPQSEGLSLPRWTLPATWASHPAQEHQRSSLLNQAVHEQFGLATAVLLITRLHGERLVIFDTLSDSPLLAGRWVSTGDIASLPIIDSDQRHILEAWFMEEREARHALMFWQKRGWFAETAAWIARQVERQGWSLQTPVEQLYTKYGACMLRATTTGGIVYLKALPPSNAARKENYRAQVGVISFDASRKIMRRLKYLEADSCIHVYGLDRLGELRDSPFDDTI